MWARILFIFLEWEMCMCLHIIVKTNITSNGLWMLIIHCLFCAFFFPSLNTIAFVIASCYKAHDLDEKKKSHQPIAVKLCVCTKKSIGFSSYSQCILRQKRVIFSHCDFKQIRLNWKWPNDEFTLNFCTSSANSLKYCIQFEAECLRALPFKRSRSTNRFDSELFRKNILFPSRFRVKTRWQ